MGLSGSVGPMGLVDSVDFVGTLGLTGFAGSVGLMSLACSFGPVPGLPCSVGPRYRAGSVEPTDLSGSVGPKVLLVLWPPLMLLQVLCHLLG